MPTRNSSLESRAVIKPKLHSLVSDLAAHGHDQNRYSDLLQSLPKPINRKNPPHQIAPEWLRGFRSKHKINLASSATARSNATSSAVAAEPELDDAEVINRNHSHIGN